MENKTRRSSHHREPKASILDRKKVLKHIELSRPLVKEMLLKAKKYSLQEYLGIAINEGLNALENGNYGIGAVYVYRHDGQEYIVAGRNGMRSKQNTHLHAEEDVIDVVESLARGEDQYKDRIIAVRKAPNKETTKTVITSLEPCIGCVRRILTHKCDAVMIGAEDDIAGAMHSKRASKLPVLWKKMRKKQKVKVVFANYDNPKSKHYIDPKYKDLIWSTFAVNRQPIDDEMEKSGLSGMGVMAQSLNALTNKEREYYSRRYKVLKRK